MSAVVHAVLEMTLALVLGWVGIIVEPKPEAPAAPAHQEQQVCESGNSPICISITHSSTASAGFSTKTCANAR